jgi:hypothetical protein
MKSARVAGHIIPPLTGLSNAIFPQPVQPRRSKALLMISISHAPVCCLQKRKSSIEMGWD